MRKKISFCTIGLLTFGVALNAAAQSNLECPLPLMPSEQRMSFIERTPAQNAGFLWRIEKAELVTWLYGTIHLNHIEYAKPGMQIMMGMRSADVLAVELNTYEPQVNVIGTTATFNLSEEQQSRLRKAYKNDCLLGDPLQTLLQPLLLSQAQRKNLFWGYSADARLMQIAKRTNKPIVALETIAEQIQALSPKSQLEFNDSIDTTLNQVESGELQHQLSKLVAAWQQSNLDVFAQLEKTLRETQPEFLSRINDQRNALMAQKIDELHVSGKRLFVAVGSLHMIGKNGLSNLLQEKALLST